MIIVRSPFRISIGGGGTDLPSFYREHTGFVISAAIDRYMYITLHETFDPQITVRYSKLERAQEISEIQHPIVREAIRLAGIENPHLELTSMADIPAGTGLGSSASFTTALLKALYTYRRIFLSPHELAELACTIEIDLLKEPVGKQDQFIASYGGITAFTFHPDERVTVEPMRLSNETLLNLEDSLLMFFTGYSRSASNILKEQDQRSKSNDASMTANLQFVKDLGYQIKEALEQCEPRKFGELMNAHWEHKKQRAGGMSNPQIDAWYKLAKANGAIGGKLIGAGGGGFLLFYTEQKQQLRHALRESGLREVRFRFDFTGTNVLAHS